MSNHKIGDVVTPNPDAGWSRNMIGRRYVITDVPKGARGVNYKAMPCDVDGKQVPGQGLRGPGWALVSPASLEEAPAPVALPPVGSIVAPNCLTDLDGGFYTVIGHTDATRIRIVKIGDTSGRYYRASARGVTVIDPAEVVTALGNIIL